MPKLPTPLRTRFRWPNLPLVRTALLLALPLLLGRCALFEDPVPVPAYVYVPTSLVLTHAGDTLPTSAHDVWVYDNLYQGTYELPARFPYTDTGRTTLIMQGGVLRDAFAAQRSAYPFWQQDTVSVSLRPGQTDTVVPTFRYLADTFLAVAYQEDFERPQVSLRYSSIRTDSAQLTTTNTDAYLGQRCGRLQFDDDSRYAEYRTLNSFALPQRNSEVWVELAYKGDIEVGISLVKVFGGLEQPANPVVPIGQVRDTSWNVVYFNVTSTARQAEPGAVFKLQLLSLSDGSNRTLLLDNLRVLYNIIR